MNVSPAMLPKLRSGPRLTAALIAAGIALAASHASAQWWWPPQMAIDPTCPHPASEIIATLSGEWPDHCVPNRFSMVRQGFRIDLDIWRDPPPGFCFTVITPWSLPVEIGMLPAGTYSVAARYIGAAGPLTPFAFIGEIQVDPACAGPICYANCDGSTMEPVLNVDDFTCFINEFAAAGTLPHEQQVTHYANCDQSTVAPVLNVDDFTCFINLFAQGCR
jgi:hypothetical protein